MSISPLIYKHTQGKLEGEFSSSSEVNWGFIPGIPSIVLSHIAKSQKVFGPQRKMLVLPSCKD